MDQCRWWPNHCIEGREVIWEIAPEGDWMLKCNQLGVSLSGQVLFFWDVCLFCRSSFLWNWLSQPSKAGLGGWDRSESFKHEKSKSQRWHKIGLGNSAMRRLKSVQPGKDLSQVAHIGQMGIVWDHWSAGKYILLTPCCLHLLIQLSPSSLAVSFRLWILSKRIGLWLSLNGSISVTSLQVQQVLPVICATRSSSAPPVHHSCWAMAWPSGKFWSLAAAPDQDAQQIGVKIASSWWKCSRGHLFLLAKQCLDLLDNFCTQLKMRDNMVKLNLSTLNIWWHPLWRHLVSPL